MKKLLILIALLALFSCASTKQNDFYKRKYHTENTKSYKSKKSLMLLDNRQLGINKYINSTKYQSRLKKTYKKMHKK
jgi:uncharacterized lipoprotein YmbA